MTLTDLQRGDCLQFDHAFDLAGTISSGREGEGTGIIQKISPVAWQHIHFLGHYTFRDNTNLIDLEAMLANVTLE